MAIALYEDARIHGIRKAVAQLDLEDYVEACRDPWFCDLIAANRAIKRWRAVRY
jgi:hypothetical protein